MDKHTAGTWKYWLEDSRKEWAIVTDKFGNIIANVNTEANALLIAAAPDLLEALKKVVAISDREHDAWDAAHAAIKKAEGGNNVKA